MATVIDFTTEHLEKIKENEVKTNALEEKIDDLSEIKENIKLLTHIQKELTQFSKDQAKVNEEFSNT